MSKKLVRLTESDLHKIIKESVKKILREETEWQANGKGFAINQARKTAPMNAIETEKMPKPARLSIDDKIEFSRRADANKAMFKKNHSLEGIVKSLLEKGETVLYEKSFVKRRGDTKFKCEELEEVKDFLLNEYGINPVIRLINKSGKEYDDVLGSYSFTADIVLKSGKSTIKFSPEDTPDYMY